VLFLGEVMLPIYILGGILIIGGAMFGELYKTKPKSCPK
jgi:drug/metabolite transporter (DMT)-like permease